jgi:N-acetylmuramoyl-L-alanine amidase
VSKQRKKGGNYMNKQLLLIGCAVLMGVLSIGAMNRLQKIELHAGNQPGGRSIERAKLICYFKDKPSIHHLQTVQTDNGWEHQTYLIMHTECETGAQRALDQITQQKHEHFFIASEKVEQPTRALKLEIGYDPQHISINHDTFDAITTQKGVLFRLINRPVLQQIATEERPLLQLAHHMVGKQVKIGIDCGHGAHDTGACCNGLVEKDLTLQIGLTLANMLHERGVTTIMTRSEDRAVALHERTTYMNQQDVDLLVSIHANSAPSASVYGIETYCAHPRLLHAQTVSVHEERLRTCLAQRFKCAEDLAHTVHKQVLSVAKQGAYVPVDRKVRHASSQLLLGCNMPAILIEVGFITNETEAQQLSSVVYQRQLAHGICQGILDFIATHKQTV